MPRVPKAPNTASTQKNNGDSVHSRKKASVSLPNPAIVYNTLSLEEEIRRRAYELYEQRGRQDGLAEEDWLRAETEVLGRRTARTA